MGGSTRLLILIRNIQIFFIGTERFLPPVTYFFTNAIHTFTLRLTSINRENFAVMVRFYNQNKISPIIKGIALFLSERQLIMPLNSDLHKQNMSRNGFLVMFWRRSSRISSSSCSSACLKLATISAGFFSFRKSSCEKKLLLIDISKNQREVRFLT